MQTKFILISAICTYNRIEKRKQIDKNFKITNSHGIFIICSKISIP